jgi:dTDP-4-dehydrorhamnose 3,5-epimerase
MKKKIEEVPFIIKKNLYFDSRGFFQELFLKKNIKFNCKFTAFSTSKKKVIRGLHYQVKKPQSKILSVLLGKALDVCVNINKNSKNFGKVHKFLLEPGKMLYVPKGYAHGIGFYKEKNILLYHLSEYRYEKYERGIMYNDKRLKIKWNIKNPILSKKDRNHPSINNI